MRPEGPEMGTFSRSLKEAVGKFSPGTVVQTHSPGGTGLWRRIQEIVALLLYINNQERIPTGKKDPSQIGGTSVVTSHDNSWLWGFD